MYRIDQLEKEVHRLSIDLRLGLVLITATFALQGCAPFLAQSPANVARSEVELLRDPGLVHGVTQSFANTLPREERADCLARWKAKGITKAQWGFWEITEKLYFAHNPDTPEVLSPGAYRWSTANGAKQITIRDGAVHMLYDTGTDWREGGNLNLPDKEGNRPKYGNPRTNWPHFLIGQLFTRDYKQLESLKDGDEIVTDKWASLRFEAEVRLNRLTKSSDWDHRPDFGVANHALFYAVFTVMPRSSTSIAEPGKIYILVPAVYSEGGGHVKGSAPWLGFDQFGDSVYFTDSQPKLKVGEWIRYDIDVKKLIHEGLAAVAKRARTQGVEESYRPEDYFLAKFIIGWEIWGGFDTDVEFKGLSLRATRLANDPG